MKEAVVHYRIRIRGRVQGVFFRATARNQALNLGLKGIVRNEADGSVYAEVEGPEDKVQQFIAWCHRGPKQAIVTEVIAEQSTPKGYNSFEVERGLYH
ncbi:MAG: acylphosphatase [Chitinophagales bacterium]|nr:acylphosphatase [Chitinophagales bacterium]MDW8427788.1 acylphosphatase [Chitinophagales bacterium]